MANFSHLPTPKDIPCLLLVICFAVLKMDKLDVGKESRYIEQSNGS